MTSGSAAPRLYLHVGPAKTGTSAVQHVLRQHDDSLVHYPRLGLWRDGAHHNLVFNVYREFSRPEIERLDVAAALAELGAGARRSARPVVISSEALFGRNLEPFLDAALGALAARRDEAEIVVVIREPFARAASAYNQAVKDPQSSERRAPGAFLRQHARDFCYAPELAKLASLGAAVHLIGYEPESDFVARFLAHLGFPPDRIPPGEARNVSLSVKGLIATLAANRVAASRAQRIRLFDALRRQRRFFAPSRFLFDAQSAQAAAPLFREDRERLALDWRFSAPAVDLARTRDEFRLTEAEAAEIAAACAPLDPAERAAMREAMAGFVEAAGGPG